MATRKKSRHKPDVPIHAPISGAESVVREFPTGANRDTDLGKLDYEGFLNPRVLEAFAKYMHYNRFLRDGSVRDSDNWQKGIPDEVCMKSLLRHVMELWKLTRTGLADEARTFALCAIIFNAQAMLLNQLEAEPGSIDQDVSLAIQQRGF